MFYQADLPRPASSTGCNIGVMHQDVKPKDLASVGSESAFETRKQEKSRGCMFVGHVAAGSTPCGSKVTESHRHPLRSSRDDEPLDLAARYAHLIIWHTGGIDVCKWHRLRSVEQHEWPFLRLAFRFIEPVAEPSKASVSSWLLDGTRLNLYCSCFDGLTLWLCILVREHFKCNSSTTLSHLNPDH